MKIINYTSENYKQCLDITSPSWTCDKIIYSDTDNFGIKIFEKTEDYDENCRRKICAIKRAIQDYPGEDLLFVDTDCYIKKIPTEVFEKYNFDIAVTRMVRRKRVKKEINSGVIFIRSNERTLKLCNEWLKLCDEYSKDKKIFAEQKALNTLIYDAYDEKIDLQAINISEEVYNFERDNAEQFIRDIHERAKILHLKRKIWYNEKVLLKIKEL